MSDAGASRAMYLVAEMRVRDRDKLLRYAAEVQPLMSRYGGRIIAVSGAGAELIEGEGDPPLIILHRWESRAGFDAFWRSPEYEPLRRLRHEACETRITVFES